MSKYPTAVNWSEPMMLAMASLRDAEDALLHGEYVRAREALDATMSSINTALALIPGAPSCHLNGNSFQPSPK